MYFTYLRRELGGRRRQTAIVALGLAVAIGLVMIVNSLSAGVRDAQAQALASLYGVGTDLTVTAQATQPGERGTGGQRFQFGSGEGATADGTRSLSGARLTADLMRGVLPAATLDSVREVQGVKSATAALSLTNATFSGQMPDFSQRQEGSGTPSDTASGAPPRGGPDGAGGSSFGIETFSVLGVDPAADGVGPFAAVTVTSGRTLASGDESAKVAVVDATYASTNSLAVGGTIKVAGEDFEVIGIVGSASTSADTAANVYIPLGVAQSLSNEADSISTVYVQADSSANLADVQAKISAAVPTATVSSQADLAASVSGSLSSATSLITDLGTWLSIIVLVVALAISVLLTSSGVSRRTREFGTLKAIGWSNSRVVSQVAGESVVQAAIGAVAGLILGGIGIAVIGIMRPTIAAAAEPLGGGMNRPGRHVQLASEIVLTAPVTVSVVLAALGVAVLGGLVAGAFGGWRAARLSPADALRSIN